MFDNTGNKQGACGPYSGMFGMNGVTTLKPGPLTLTWEESVAHVGSPFRISILDENENVQVVLLDHIPHDDSAKATPYIEGSYQPYHITVTIPDVKCEKCVLQLVYFMTDKTTKCGVDVCTYYPQDSACSGHTDAAAGKCFGAPNDIPCEKADACFSNYHTCTDVAIEGVKSFVDFEMDLQPATWPWKNLTMGRYGLEDAEWEGGWLKDVPKEFTSLVGFLPEQKGCA